MIMKKSFSLILILILFISCSKESDLSIDQWLKEKEYSFEIDEEGDYHIIIDLQRRSQQVWIYGKPHIQDDQEIREIFSPAWIGDELYSSIASEQLLTDNFENSLWGFWGMSSQENKRIIFYQIQLAEENKFVHLEKAIYTCALQADNLEKQWNSGVDKF